MKRPALAAALLLSCAAHQQTQSRQSQAQRTDPPAVSERSEPAPQATGAGAPQAQPVDPSPQARAPTTPADPSRRWTPQQRENVRSQCQAQMGQRKFCDCLTDKLEVISPDPRTELSHDDIVQGLEACESTPADSTETSG